ncbi:MAG: VOC family protein [Myxococcota bacterium]
MQLNQVTLPCADYAASIAFYRALGLVQIVDAPPRYARFESPAGDGATLSIHRSDEPVTAASVVYFDHESPEALDAHVAELKARGLVFDGEPRDESWGWREARLKDPAGNAICLMFAGDTRRFPSWRIDGRQR